jgi:hypothetical protein
MATDTRPAFKRQLNITKQGGMIPTLFRGWKDWKAGDALMAEFVSTKMTTYQGKPCPNHICKVLECNFQVSKDGKMVNPTGELLTLNSAGTINKLLETAEKGMVFQFVYEGKKRGTDPKDFQLYHNFSDTGLEEITSSNDYEMDASDAL